MVFRRAFLDCFYVASLAGFGVLAGVPRGKRARRVRCTLYWHSIALSPIGRELDEQEFSACLAFSASQKRGKTSLA